MIGSSVANSEGMRRHALFILLALAACSSSSEPADDAIDAGSDVADENHDDGGHHDAPNDAPLPSPVIQFFTKATVDSAETEATSAFWSDIVIARVSGLAPGSSVALRSTLRMPDGHYGSHARFEANEAGEVDTSRDAPLEGTWEGADPEGLIWSMTKVNTQPEEPLELWSMRVDAEIDDVNVAGATLVRYLVSDNVHRVALNQDGLVGAMYAPTDGEKHPVVVTFGGSEGGLLSAETDAAYLAGLGYTALGLAYFNSTGLPNSLSEIPLEYFERAMSWLDGRPEADATKLALMGGSRGGELALLLGATFPRVSAVVARVPSGVLWGAPQFSGPEKASWTLEGEPLPFVPMVDAAPTSIADTDGTKLWAYTPTFHAALGAATAAQIDAATPRVENTKGPILLIGGADDQVWPSCALAEYAMARLDEHKKTHEDELLCIPDAGHLIGIPGSPTTGSYRAYHSLMGRWLALGGTPKSIAKANREADTKIRAFLARALQ